MRVALLTREYPPEVYGGAGVHVEYLARELARLVDVTVHCWGADRADGGRRRSATGRGMRSRSERRTGPRCRRSRSTSRWRPASRAPRSCTATRGTPTSPGTWPAALRHPARRDGAQPRAAAAVEGRAARRRLRALVAGASGPRSRRPTRSSRCRRGCARDVLACYPAIDPARVEVIYNGDRHRRVPARPGHRRARALRDRPGAPSVVFVGRITRQKGVPYLLEAALDFDPQAQLVLCAGAPDTPEIGAEVERRVERLRAERGNVIWLDRDAARSARSSSSSATRPCSSARRSTSRSGSSTSRRWPARRRSSRPRPAGSSRSWRTALPDCWCRSSRAPTGAGAARSRRASSPASPTRVNELLRDPDRARAMGRAGRQRVIEHFAWPAIAEQTAQLYRSISSGGTKGRAGTRPPHRIAYPAR